MARRFVVIAAALSVLLALGAGWGSVAHGANIPEPLYPAPGPKQKIVWGMPVPVPLAIHAPVALAKELGFADRFNLDLEIQGFSGSTRALTAAIAGEIHTGYIDCVAAYGNGVPVVVYMSPGPKIPVAMVSRDTITDIRELKGKRLGMASAPGGFTDRMNRAVLEAAGYEYNDAITVAVSLDLRVVPLVTGQTDTMILHYEQTSQVLQEHPGFHVLYDLYKALPDHVYNEACALKEVVEANREALINLAAATIAATRYAYEHPEEAIPALMRITGHEEVHARYAYERIVEGCMWARNHGIDLDRYNWSIDYLHKAGDLRNPYDAAELVDMEMAEEAVRRAGGPMDLPPGCF